MSEATGQTWTDEQFAAYELGMQTEREHQNALSRLVMEKHAQALAAKDARIESLEQANRDLRMELSAYQAAHNRTLPSGDTRQRRKPTND